VSARVCSILVIVVLFTVAPGWRALGQDIERPGPPPRDDFERGGDGDGVPDGWYNLRDTHWVKGGVGKGVRALRFEASKSGRPARASRAFGIDGRKVESVVISTWVRAIETGPAERTGDSPGLLLEFFDEELRPVGRGRMGPWTVSSLAGTGWTKVARRIPVPKGTRDVILTVGLLGARGVLELDEMLIDLEKPGGEPVTNLVWNGDAELGDPSPPGWILEGSARRVVAEESGNGSIELDGGMARAILPVAGRIPRGGTVSIRAKCRWSGLRAGAVAASAFVLGRFGQVNEVASRTLWRHSGGSDARVMTERLAIPADASHLVVQFERFEGGGSWEVDDVVVVADPDPSSGTWTPGAIVLDEAALWPEYAAVAAIEPGSALDFSGLVGEAGGAVPGRVMARAGRFQRANSQAEARFFGAVLLPPLAFAVTERTDALVERLWRSGLNHVQLDGFDAAFGPGVSLFDDSRDDTRAFDPEAMRRFDHLTASLARRGMSYSLDLISERLFREGDGTLSGLPAGGGPAAGFDPEVAERVIQTGRALLAHRNGETGRTVAEDPALAWVAIAGERSVFDLSDGTDALPESSLAGLKRALERQGYSGAGSAGWRALEESQWTRIVASLKEGGLRVPIAGSAHWRREPEFVRAQRARSLDFVSDRIYWTAPFFLAAEDRGITGVGAAVLTEAVNKKRAEDRPYVLTWVVNPAGAWASPNEGSDLGAVAWVGLHEGWSGLVRRGVFAFPREWGAGATGTTGGEDVFEVSSVLNANPVAMAILPHAASIFLRGRGQEKPRAGAGGDLPRAGEAWVIQTPWTQGVLSSPGGGDVIRCEDVEIEVETPGATVLVSSCDGAPIASSRRLLLTAVGRVEPTGARWVDFARRIPASWGEPPLRIEPVRARAIWRRGGREKINGFALDPSGKRAGPVKEVTTKRREAYELDGSRGTQHWELIVDTPDEKKRES
jgi:hypothetical protein